MIQIPVPDENDSLSEIPLEGETFFFHFSWNESGAYWTLSIENANKDALASGIKIVPNTPLLTQIMRPYLPSGELMAIVPDRRNTIGRDDLPSGQAVIVYVTAEEMEAYR